MIVYHGHVDLITYREDKFGTYVAIKASSGGIQ